MKLLLSSIAAITAVVFSGCALTYQPNNHYTSENIIINNIKYYSDINCNNIDVRNLNKHIKLLMYFSEKRDEVLYKNVIKLKQIVMFKTNSQTYCELKKEQIKNSIDTIENYIIAKENYGFTRTK